jgi:hypothetical protein
MFGRNINFLVVLFTALSLASFTMALMPGVQAKSTSKPMPPGFNGPPISGLLASAADFTSDNPGVGQITMTSCTDGTDLGGGNIRVNCDSISLPHNEMSIAVDPTNPSHIVAGSNDYEIFFIGSSSIERIIAGFYTSFDGGTTWINGHIAPGGFTFNGDPAIAFNTKFGVVDYATIASNGGQKAGFATATIQVNTSPDGGQTFGHPVVVALGMGGTRVTVFNDKPYIAVDNNPASPFYGRVYVTWTRFTFDQFGNYISSPIFLSFSDDGGQTFSTGQEISGTSSTLCANPFRSFNTNRCNEDQFSSPVVGPDGTVYVAFENEELQGASTGFRNQYLVVSSTNGGASFGAPSQAVFPIFDGGNDYPINVDGRQTLTNSQFRVNSAGNLAIDPSSGPTPATTRLYIAFSDNRKGVALCAPSCSFTTVTTNTDVLVVSSTNGGASWGSPVTVPHGGTSDNDQFYPWAAVSSTGVLKVAFKDRSYDPSNIQYGETLATSTDNGASFTSIRVDTGLSNPNDSRWFTGGGTTNGKATFIGDYEGLAVGSDGISHPLWTDMRTSRFPSPPPGRGHNTQDAVTASV